NRLLRFRERNHVAQRVSAAKHHANPIDSKCYSAVGRRSVFERVEQKAEAIDRLFARQPQQFKYLQLQLAAMDTNRAAAELLAVEHHVVRERASLERRGLEDREVIGI